MKKIRFLTLTFIFLVIVSIHSVDAASVQETSEILHHSIAANNVAEMKTLSMYHTLMISLKDSAKEIGTSIPRVHPNTVQVKVSQASLQKRIEQLEKAIAPKTPEETVRLWFEGLKNRNGAIQFAVSAPNLRTPEWLKAYEQWDWKLPGSSPWIASYKLNGKKTGEKSWDYAVDYILIDSTGRKKIATLNLTVQQFDNNWYVSKVPKGYGGVAS
ncbi:hypothetical protein [Aneurinibacillus tyrosinisolvens]|uniref:hypothetical protein n=1 Tax=Aneurinibacillus tyrosinisolvens TaxID=1443435 RepID=UPI00063F466B|nr:hypothetical protein [Aneurinibacillus tyrosinisolvens]